MFLKRSGCQLLMYSFLMLVLIRPRVFLARMEADSPQAGMPFGTAVGRATAGSPPNGFVTGQFQPGTNSGQPDQLPKPHKKKPRFSTRLLLETVLSPSTFTPLRSVQFGYASGRLITFSSLLQVLLQLLQLPEPLS